jgi:hypothetical protein
MYTCRNHPSYRGFRKPSGKNADCATCWEIYAEMLEYRIQTLTQEISQIRKNIEEFQNSSY